MATISDIARAANVSVETVLRVLNRDDVSEEVSRHVTAVIDAHGFRKRPDDRSAETEAGRPPDRHQPSSAADALAPRTVVRELVNDAPKRAIQGESVVEGAREHLLQAVARAATEADAGRSPVPSSLRYESFEVGPLAERMTLMDRLVERLLENLEGLDGELRRGRTERLEDFTLLVDLITTSWRTVDQRLNRIERTLDRPREQTRSDGDC